MLRFPLIRPDIPPIAEWMPLLHEAYGSRQFSNFGPLSKRLEQFIGERWGGPETVCVTTSSGTAAIAAPLLAAGVQGRVVLPAFTFIATLMAIRMAGAEPFLVDVSPADWRMPADALSRALDTTGARSAVILCPFGLRSDFTSHAGMVGRRGGLLVVDNAAGLGVERQRLETAPHCFEACSLHATKPLAVGEGGVIFAHHSREEDLRRALNFGLTPGAPAEIRGRGINGKLSELHAAVGIAAVCRFEARLARRRSLVVGYVAAVSAFEGVEACTDPHAGSWQFFPVLLPDADAAARFVDAAAARGMEARRYYVPALSALGDVDRLGPCPVAEDLAARMCCVPVYADASAAEATELVAVFGAALGDALGKSANMP